MINYLQLKNEKLSIMTFEKLNNDIIDHDNIEDIINLSESISKIIKYNDLVEILKTTDKGKAKALSSLMHEPAAHRYILKSMKAKVVNLEGSYNLDGYIERIRDVIIGLKIYEKINPKEDYVFCHGDFDINNVLYDSIVNKYYIIDWSSYRLGLKGYDVTKFLWSFGMTFSEIEKLYLNSVENQKQDQDTIINKIFLTYNLLRLWIGRLDTRNIEKQIYECISPAIEYMEDLAEKSDRYGLK